MVRFAALYTSSAAISSIWVLWPRNWKSLIKHKMRACECALSVQSAVANDTVRGAVRRAAGTAAPLEGNSTRKAQKEDVLSGECWKEVGSIYGENGFIAAIAQYGKVMPLCKVRKIRQMKCLILLRITVLILRCDHSAALQRVAIRDDRWVARSLWTQPKWLHAWWAQIAVLMASKNCERQRSHNIE